MGSSFSNISIRKREGMTQEAVAKALSGLMADRGFAPADEESADVSFALFTLPDSQWYTVCENAMLFEDIEDQQKSAGRLSLALDSDALAIFCFDSDYLYLNLINPAKKLDAWASVGSAAGLGIKRRTGLAAWKSALSEPEKFKEAIKKHYDFAEEALEEAAPLLGLPCEQGFCEYELLTELLPDVCVEYLHFAMPAGEKCPLPPVLYCIGRSLTPNESGHPQRLSVVNRGGAGKGIEVLFFGGDLAEKNIVFTDVTLIKHKKGDNVHTPVELEKVTLENGESAFRGVVPNYRIPERVSDALPPTTRIRKEYDLEIALRYIPRYEGGGAISFDVVMRPLQNPEGGLLWRR